ncbi:hypothetical protein [Nonomuraea pusilla]|uniref:Uncharacterized protein n=1 Tax=Nonomuraea pusilla TaxID=46177 RepID=A0A1H8B492_9ACTN|nr:hypothetical protein [Nonomuraea pusilla]SEM77721.1 hypothetical protein SAMN05660976_06017 [Nonomuraea pusilla]
MKDTARIALALAAGYYLGRRHKMRLATILTAVGIARRLRHTGEGGAGGGLLGQGLKTLGSSPQIEELTSRLRGDLLQVGKAAVMAAANKQIDSLTQKLTESAEQAGGRGREEAEYEEPEAEYEEYEEEPEEAPRARTRATAPQGGRGRTQPAAQVPRPRQPASGRKRPVPATRRAG